MIDKRSKQLTEYVFNYQKNQMSMENLISIAENNRILYPVAVQNSEMRDIAQIGDKWILKLTNTLKEIETILSKDEYVVTRTYKYIDYVTFDVDVFVEGKKFKEVINKFGAKGFTIESHDSSLGGRLPSMQVNIKKEGLLTIDLHQDFTWQKRQFLDQALVMKKSKKREIAGRNVLTPSPEIELLLCMADMSHERFNITLLDIIWLKGLSSEIKDWEFVFGQAKKYKWLNILKMISAIVNQLSLDIFQVEIIPGITPKKGNYKLPYFLSLVMCWKIYLNTFLSYRRFPFISFLYMHYNQLKYLLKGAMPYYSPWHI